MKIIVGCDPGATGAIAHYTTTMQVVKMPDNVHDIRDYFKSIKLLLNEGDSAEVFLEAVHAMPGNGACSMFKFGKGVGQIEGILATLDLPVVMVTPQKWQKHFSLPKSKTFGTKTLWKKHLREVALSRWPSTDIHRESGDAVLIATYGIDTRRENIRADA